MAARLGESRSGTLRGWQSTASLDPASPGSGNGGADFEGVETAPSNASSPRDAVRRRVFAASMPGAGRGRRGAKEAVKRRTATRRGTNRAPGGGTDDVYAAYAPRRSSKGHAGGEIETRTPAPRTRACVPQKQWQARKAALRGEARDTRPAVARGGSVSAAVGAAASPPADDAKIHEARRNSAEEPPDTASHSGPAALPPPAQPGVAVTVGMRTGPRGVARRAPRVVSTDTALPAQRVSPEDRRLRPTLSLSLLAGGSVHDSEWTAGASSPRGMRASPPQGLLHAASHLTAPRQQPGSAHVGRVTPQELQLAMSYATTMRRFGSEARRNSATQDPRWGRVQERLLCDDNGEAISYVDSLDYDNEQFDAPSRGPPGDPGIILIGDSMTTGDGVPIFADEFGSAPRLPPSPQSLPSTASPASGAGRGRLRRSFMPPQLQTLGSVDEIDRTAVRPPATRDTRDGSVLAISSVSSNGAAAGKGVGEMPVPAPTADDAAAYLAPQAAAMSPRRRRPRSSTQGMPPTGARRASRPPVPSQTADVMSALILAPEHSAYSGAAAYAEAVSPQATIAERYQYYRNALSPRDSLSGRDDALTFAAMALHGGGSPDSKGSSATVTPTARPGMGSPTVSPRRAFLRTMSDVPAVAMQQHTQAGARSLSMRRQDSYRLSRSACPLPPPPPGGVRGSAPPPAAEGYEQSTSARKWLNNFNTNATTVQVFIRAAWSVQHVLPRLRAVRLRDRILRFIFKVRALAELRRRRDATAAQDDARVAVEEEGKELALREICEMWERRIRATVRIQKLIRRVRERRVTKQRNRAALVIQRTFRRGYRMARLREIVRETVRRARDEQLMRFVAARLTFAVMCRRSRDEADHRARYEQRGLVAFEILLRFMRRLVAVKTLAAKRALAEQAVLARVERERELYSSLDFLAVHRCVLRCEGLALIRRMRHHNAALQDARTAKEKTHDRAALVIQAFATVKALHVARARRLYVERFCNQTVRIQAFARGIMAKRQFQQLKQKAQNKEDARVACEAMQTRQEDALQQPRALLVQRMARGWLARLRLRRQDIVIGGRRGVFNQRRLGVIESVAMRDHDWWDREHYACILQRFWRCARARIRLDAARQRLQQEYTKRLMQERAIACFTIQCLWRRWWGWKQQYGTAASLIAPWFRWRMRCLARKRIRAAHVVRRALIRGTALFIQRRAILRIQLVWRRKARRKATELNVKRWLHTDIAVHAAAAIRIQVSWRFARVRLAEARARLAIRSERSLEAAQLVHAHKCATAGWAAPHAVVRHVVQAYVTGAEGVWAEEDAARAELVALHDGALGGVRHAACLRRIAGMRRRQRAALVHRIRDGAERVADATVETIATPAHGSSPHGAEWQRQLLDQGDGQLDRLLWHVPNVPVRLIEQARGVPSTMMLTPAPPAQRDGLHRLSRMSNTLLRRAASAASDVPRISATPTPTHKKKAGARQARTPIPKVPYSALNPGRLKKCDTEPRRQARSTTPRLYVPSGRDEYAGASPTDLQRRWASDSDTDDDGIDTVPQRADQYCRPSGMARRARTPAY